MLKGKEAFPASGLRRSTVSDENLRVRWIAYPFKSEMIFVCFSWLEDVTPSTFRKSSQKDRDFVQIRNGLLWGEGLLGAETDEKERLSD